MKSIFVSATALLIATASSTPLNARQLPGVIPLAASTIVGCDVQLPANEIDNCETMAYQGILTLAQFLTYNPVLGADCSNMKIGQAYCIHVPDANRPKEADLVKPVAPKPKVAPGKTFGPPSNCQQWQKIFPDDVKNKKSTCEGLAKIWGDSRLGATEVQAWLNRLNTGLGADCANIEVGSYLCVRVPLQTGRMVA